MPPMATSPPTSPCAWPSWRASQPRELAQAIVNALRAGPGHRARGDRRRGLHQFLPRRAMRRPTWCAACTNRAMPSVAMAPAAAARCWWSSCRRIPPARCMWATAGTAPYGASVVEPARSQWLCRAPRVLHQRCRPADGHPRRQRLAALPRGLRREVPLPGQRLQGRLRPRDRRRTCCRRSTQRLLRPEGEVFGNLPPDEPEGGDKDAYIDAVIARAQRADRRGGLPRSARSRPEGDPRRHGKRPARVRRALRPLVLRSARWPTNGAIDRALERLRKQDHVYEKDGALWFRATAFGDEKDRVVVRENGVKTYFASDIAYHLDKRERGFDLLLDILGSDHHGYVARVRAGLEAMGEPRRIAGSAAGAVRVAVPRRREGADVHARRRVRHAAPAAQRSGQRRRALLLCDAQPRPAPGLRPGAGQVAAATTTRCITSSTRMRAWPACCGSWRPRAMHYDAAHGPCEPRHADLGARDRAADRAGPLSGDHPAWPARTARRIRWCTTCANSRTASTPGTTPSSSSSRTPQLRNARLALALATQQVVRNGLQLLGVSAPETM